MKNDDEETVWIVREPSATDAGSYVEPFCTAHLFFDLLQSFQYPNGSEPANLSDKNFILKSRARAS